MGLVRGFKKVVKPFINAPEWMGAESLIESGHQIGKNIASLFTVKKPKREESFEEAKERLNLSDQDIFNRCKEFRILTIIFSCLTTALFLYAISLFLHAHYPGGFVAIGITCVSFAQVFRNHFWLYQLREKRLGCTFSEWFHCGVRGKKL